MVGMMRPGLDHNQFSCALCHHGERVLRPPCITPLCLSSQSRANYYTAYELLSCPFMRQKIWLASLVGTMRHASAITDSPPSCTTTDEGRALLHPSLIHTCLTSQRRAYYYTASDHSPCPFMQQKIWLAIVYGRRDTTMPRP